VFLRRRVNTGAQCSLLILVTVISMAGRTASAGHAVVEGFNTIVVFADDDGQTIRVMKTFVPPTGFIFLKMSNGKYASYFPSVLWAGVSNNGGPTSVTIKVASLGPPDADSFAFHASGCLIEPPEEPEEGGGPGVTIPIPWGANVKPQVLVLTDLNGGGNTSDGTGSVSDDDTPTLSCSAAQDDSKLDVSFYVKAEDVTEEPNDYAWSVEGGGYGDSGTMDPGQTITQNNLEPGIYYLHVTGGAIVRRIRFSTVAVTMTAYRPQTDPFARTAVPDHKEEIPGAGIRINGDDDDGDSTADRSDGNGVAGEDDLIEVTLGVVPWPAPTGYEYVLQRSSDKIKVWTSQTKASGSEIAFTDNEAVVAMSASSKTIWVEWADADHGTSDLKWIARRVSDEAIACLDKVHFYTFHSVVIVLGGEESPAGFKSLGYSAPDDPAPAGHGVFQSAIDLFRDGYNVYMFGENSVNDGGDGIVYDTVVQAIQAHKIEEVAICGYSHGGGSTCDLADKLTFNAGPIGRGFSIEFTAYIDALQNDSDWDLNAEAVKPPGSAHHANYYQSGCINPISAEFDWGFDGCSVAGASPNLNVEDHAPGAWGDCSAMEHSIIDDLNPLLSEIEGFIQAEVSR